MAISRFYSNIAVPGALGANISNAATTMFLSATPVGYPTQFPFTLALDPGTASFELVSVTAGNGTSGTPWTITRAYGGTTASAHNIPGSGNNVFHEFSAEDVATSRTHENMGSGSGVHGLPSAAWQTASFAVINETTLANSTTATQTWSSIPATYNHLMVVVLGRLTETTALTDWVNVQLNGDSGVNYSWVNVAATNISGTLVAPFDNTAFSATAMNLIRMAASQGGGNANAGGAWIFFPWYTSTAFNKHAYAMTAAGNGTSSMVDGEVSFGFYNPASQVAINSISLNCPASCFFKTGTSFGLYGVN